MRKFILFVLGLSAFSCSIFARQISSEEAMTAARSFLDSKSAIQTRGASPVITLATPSADIAYHAFNVEDGRGFVIVSAEGDEPCILGYADKGIFDCSNIPPQLRGILAKSIESKSAPRLITRGEKEGVLYETAEWGQGYPYNALAPEIDGEKTQAGCVATAMAIAMKYHNWPDYTRGGEQKDYYHPDHTFDFSNYTIDWEALNDKDSEKFADEVGKLMYSAGVACPMNYGVEESVAEVWPIGNKMIELFTYAKGCQYIERKRFSDEVWNEMLREQLDKVGPVIYRGGTSVGHCFVIDGYDSDGFYHVNWGWDGGSNGYYALDFSDIGGMSFGEEQGMVINISPDKERREYSKSFIPNVDLYFAGAFGMEGWNFMKSDITPDEPIILRTPTTVLNGHIGFYTIGVVDEDDNILWVSEDGTYNIGTPDNCAYPGNDPTLELTLPALKEGERYQLVTMESIRNEEGLYVPDYSTDPKYWRIVLGGMIYPSYFYATGNTSNLAEFRVHIDEKLPYIGIGNYTSEHEYTAYALKGGSFSENMQVPLYGVTLEVKSYDKEGNEMEPWVTINQDEGSCSYTISAYTDFFDVYVKYEYDGDTRRDSNVDPSYIVEQDGLIYKIDSGSVILIGYDEIGDTVVIPDYVEADGKKLPLVKIGADALLMAPVKHIVFNASQVVDMGNCAFAGLGQLESIVFNNAFRKESYYNCPFLSTDGYDVIFHILPTSEMIEALSSTYRGSRACSFDAHNLDMYVAKLPITPDDYGYANPIWIYKELMDNYKYEKTINSYNIPGVDKTEEVMIFEDSKLPVKQMWTYSIDKSKGIVRFDNVAENVKIQKVTFNDEEAEGLKDGYYKAPKADPFINEVVVEYTVNGKHKLVTTYSAYYNDFIESSTFEYAGVDIVGGDDTESYDVFNLQGVKVLSKGAYADVKALPAGIYIINGKKITLR